VTPTEPSGRGALIVIAAPSGAGKTTLVHVLLERRPDLRFSISYTTRKPRPQEKDGIDYFFVDENEFEAMVEAGEFLEHALVFDHWYGTGKAYVQSLRTAGHSVLLEIDWQGARQVRQAVPDATTIFIVPPSFAELERRLRGRGTDSGAVIERRLSDALSDLAHWAEFDYVIVNEDVDAAAAELAAVVGGHGELNRRENPALRARVEGILAASR
jgi:guanylate kinase